MTCRQMTMRWQTMRWTVWRQRTAWCRRMTTCQRMMQWTAWHWQTSTSGRTECAWPSYQPHWPTTTCQQMMRWTSTSGRTECAWPSYQRHEFIGVVLLGDDKTVCNEVWEGACAGFTGAAGSVTWGRRWYSVGGVWTDIFWTLLVWLIIWINNRKQKFYGWQVRTHKCGRGNQPTASASKIICELTFLKLTIFCFHSTTAHLISSLSTSGSMKSASPS